MNMFFRIILDYDTLVSEIVAKIPEKHFVSETDTFLDPAFAGGQLLKAVARRLNKYGHSIENIRSRLFGYEDSIAYLNHSKNKSTAMIAQLSVVKYQEFLNMNKNMKFDAIVSNPPYQKEGNAKRWVLWHEFIKKSIDLSENVAMVVPASLVGPGSMFDTIKNNTRILNLDVKKHFAVGSTFCYFVYDKSFTGNTRIITDKNTFDIDLTNKQFLPPIITRKTLNMMDVLSGNRIWKRGEYHTSDKEWATDTGMEVIHTAAQTLSTKRPHPNTAKIRVGVTLSGYPKFVAVEDKGFSQACFWTEFNTMAEAKDFEVYCNSEEIQEILKTYKWSGWNSKAVIIKL